MRGEDLSQEAGLSHQETALSNKEVGLSKRQD